MKNRKITNCLTINVVRRTPLQTIGHVRAPAPDSVDENKKIPAPQLAARVLTEIKSTLKTIPMPEKLSSCKLNVSSFGFG